jgi:hypothetical protein
MKHAIKDQNNPFFRSKYADLASVVDASRPALVACGLAVCQYTVGNTLYTMLLHESGEWIRGSIDLKPMRQVKDTGWVASDDPQSFGSCLTYARRYGMAAITGVATEDDDGNAATGMTAQESEQKAAPTLDQDLVSAFDATGTMDDLKTLWNKIPVGSRHGYTAHKDAAKQRIAATPKESAA